jgi:hypothetical protein
VTGRVFGARRGRGYGSRVPASRTWVAPLVLLACTGPTPATPSAAPDAPSPAVADAAVSTPSVPAPPISRPPDTIFRDELVRATRGGKPGYLLSQLGPPEAWRVDGRFRGWRVLTVFPDDPELCAAGCDLRPGDVVLTVNGSPLERPEQLSELVGQITTMSRLAVKLVRDADPATPGMQGALHERTFAIVDR